MTGPEKHISPSCRASDPGAVPILGDVLKPTVANDGAGTTGDRVLTGVSPDILGRIHDPEVELVIWKREMPPGLGRWLDRLPVSRMPHGRVLVGATDLSRAVLGLVEEGDMPAEAERDIFTEDVLRLTRLFMQTMETDLVDIRLETICHDACRKFHRDHVAARLLTTYRGPGTEWVRPKDGEGAIAEQQSFQGRIERFPVHTVGLFKGNRCDPSTGIVHRSPPVARTGEVRLLLCLNLPSIVSPPPWRPGG